MDIDNLREQIIETAQVRIDVSFLLKRAGLQEKLERSRQTFLDKINSSEGVQRIAHEYSSMLSIESSLEKVNATIKQICSPKFEHLHLMEANEEYFMVWDSEFDSLHFPWLINKSNLQQSKRLVSELPSE